MAANDTAALVVALSAQVSKFQKDMDQATSIAARTVTQIEDRFKNINIGLGKIISGTAIGGALSAAIGDPIGAAISQVQQLGSEFSKTATMAKFLQISITRVQELQFGAALKGVDFETFRSESAQFLRNAEEAKRALDEVGTLSAKQINRVENDFARLFKANRISLVDANGELLKFDELLLRAADLVRNAKTELDKVRIAEMLGLSREWVRVLEQGSDGFRSAAAEARSAGAVFDSELVKRAKEFDKAWEEAMVRFKVRLKQTLVESREFFGGLITSVKASFGDVEAIVERIATLEDRIAAARRLPPEVGDRIIAKLQEELDLMRKRVEEENRLRVARGQAVLNLTVQKKVEDEIRPPTGDESTVVPFKLKNRETEFDREVKSIQKRAAMTDVETASIGKNTYEKERAKATQELLTAAEQAGLTVTDDMRKKIDAVAAAYALAAKHAEEAKNRFDGVNESMKFFGNQTATILEGVLNKTTTFADGMRAALRSLQSELIKAALTGEGVFAKLLGTVSTTGGTGGLFGTFAAALTGKQGGGSVFAGNPYMVGEHGPELFVPGSSGMIAPNDVLRRGSAASPQVSIVNHVDASGADSAAIARLTRGLVAVNASIEERVVTGLSRHRALQG